MTGKCLEILGGLDAGVTEDQEENAKLKKSAKRFSESREVQTMLTQEESSQDVDSVI